MAQKHKNPLNVMFGAFLQEERKRLFANVSVAELSKDTLRMSVSLYKMTEAGLSSISLNRLIPLIETFKDSNIIFDRLLKFVGGQNIVDHLMSSKELTPKDAFAELASVDEEFRELFLKVEKYFELEEDSKQQKVFLEEFAVKEVHRFLENQRYSHADNDNYVDVSLNERLFKKVEHLPSLNIELLFNFIGSFAQITPLHFQEIASKWEEDNSQKFQCLCGLFEKPELIVSEYNLKTFHHSYLLHEGFAKAKYIFGSKGKFKNLEAIYAAYYEILNSTRKKEKYTEIPLEIIKEKVLIKILPENKNEIVKELLRSPYSLSKILQAFWVFDLGEEKDNKISFAGVADSNANIVYNLSYGQTLKRAALLEKLWNSIK